MTKFITKWRFLEHGAAAPKKSRFKGIIDTESVVGLLNYETRESALDKEKDVSINDSWLEYLDKETSTLITSSNISSDKQLRFMISKHFEKKGNLIYQCILSFEDYLIAGDAGMNSSSDYQRMMNVIMPNQIRAMGLDPSNCVWWGAYHVDTDNPHIHINFLEKNQTRSKGKLNKREINNFKNQIAKEVGLNEEIEKLTGLSYLEYFKEKDNRFREVMSIVRQNDFNKPTMALIYEFYKKLPKSGRLQYNSSHIAPYKKDLDYIISTILASDELRGNYRSWLQTVDTFDANMKSFRGESGFRETELKKLYTQIGNSILQNKKSLFKEGMSRNEFIKSFNGLKYTRPTKAYLSVGQKRIEEELFEFYKSLEMKM